jgi:hypothetical protein
VGFGFFEALDGEDGAEDSVCKEYDAQGGSVLGDDVQELVGKQEQQADSCVDGYHQKAEI